jgi:hypothetical protein
MATPKPFVYPQHDFIADGGGYASPPLGWLN